MDLHTTDHVRPGQVGVDLGWEPRLRVELQEHVTRQETLEGETASLWLTRQGQGSQPLQPIACRLPHPRDRKAGPSSSFSGARTGRSRSADDHLRRWGELGPGLLLPCRSDGPSLHERGRDVRHARQEEKSDPHPSENAPKSSWEAMRSVEGLPKRSHPPSIGGNAPSLKGTAIRPVSIAPR